MFEVYGVRSSMWAECRACLKGLQIAKELNLTCIKMELDSQM